MVTQLSTGWKARSRHNRGIIVYRVNVDRETWGLTLVVKGRKDGKDETRTAAIDPDLIATEIATERAAELLWDTGSTRLDPLKSLLEHID